MSTKIHKRRALTIVVLRLVGCGPPSKVVRITDAQRYTSARCLSHQGCPFTPSPLPRCVDELPTISLSELFQQAPTPMGQRVRVHGPLHMGSVASTLAECFPGECCNETTVDFWLGDPRSTEPSVRLRGPMCRGDDSKVCCETVASGQDVVVEGILMPQYGDGRDPTRSTPSKPAWLYAITSGTNEPRRLCSRSARLP